MLTTNTKVKECHLHKFPRNILKTIRELKLRACNRKHLSCRYSSNSQLDIVIKDGEENRSSVESFSVHREQGKDHDCSRSPAKPALSPEWADRALNNLERLFKEQLKTASRGGR